MLAEKITLGIIALMAGLLIGAHAHNILTGELTLNPLSGQTGSYEKKTPGDWISERQIHAYEDSVTIDIPGAEAARFANTKSMEPAIDSNTNAIIIKPKTEAQIKEGDIVYYESPLGKISHRIVHIGKDENGWYGIAKGDNSQTQDPYKIRFPQIKGIVIALIY
ncbi:hypothetical protein HYY72_00365 [Candidatus Woesearchaeota archaeon]|nr:hypothetical protein [Candidatus Woesearchaeota archaeon]